MSRCWDRAAIHAERSQVHLRVDEVGGGDRWKGFVHKGRDHPCLPAGERAQHVAPRSRHGVVGAMQRSRRAAQRRQLIGRPHVVAVAVGEQDQAQLLRRHAGPSQRRHDTVGVARRARVHEDGALALHEIGVGQRQLDAGNGGLRRHRDSPFGGHLNGVLDAQAGCAAAVRRPAANDSRAPAATPAASNPAASSVVLSGAISGWARMACHVSRSVSPR